MASQAWNRDAVPAEKAGFDCAKAHPAQGNYHHHQNPSAFNLDLNVISTVCDTYPSDGLYVINSSEHSPLLGFAYDGFPIYGAYAYANTDGSGAITRMKSSYQLKIKQPGQMTRRSMRRISTVISGKITNTFRMLATLAIWTCTTGDFVSPQNIPRVFIAILQPLTRITIRPIRML
jgi:hypothetical protein